MLDNMQIRVPLLVFGEMIMKGVDQSMFENFYFLVVLGVKGNVKIKSETQKIPESFPKGTKKKRVHIINNSIGKYEVGPNIWKTRSTI
jgi:hypothetical protein